jgi:SAM-dependent methyltransferase
MASPAFDRRVSLPDFLACPSCKAQLGQVEGRLDCPSCGATYPLEGGVPLLFEASAFADDAERQQALYNQVAHEYDDVFPRHVANHYLDKRVAIVRSLLPAGRVLDVGCGTGQLAERIVLAGYEVMGVDISPAMLQKALARGLAGTFAAFSSALPFRDGSFDLALTVATLHHLETPVRVAYTIAEMGRVVKPGGYVLIWDHNPLNPYWPILMKRVPQDHGDERLVSVWEILDGVRAAGLTPVEAARTGLVPDFMPSALMPIWTRVEALVEANPFLSLFAAHNVVVAQKP